MAVVSSGRDRYRGRNFAGNDIFLPCAELYSTGAGSKCCSTIFAFKRKSRANVWTTVEPTRRNSDL